MANAMIAPPTGNAGYGVCAVRPIIQYLAYKTRGRADNG